MIGVSWRTPRTSGRRTASGVWIGRPGTAARRNVAGPLSLRLLFQAFVVIVGFLMLAGAVNTAVVGSNGVLNRVSEDGGLTEWFRKPHAKYGTTYRLINLVVLLQLLTIVLSRGDVYVLGEAYAFGVVWSFAFKSLAMLVLLGAADMLSVVVRSTLIQIRTPDEMRGRVSAVNLVFIGASNELGEFESGVTAAWLGPEAAVVMGGIGTCIVVVLWALLFPSLRKVWLQG